MNISRFLIVILLVSSSITLLPHSAPAYAAPDSVRDLHEDYWTEIGPDAGAVDLLAIDPFNSTIVYAGGLHTGLFRSVSKGDSWVRLFRGLTDHRITSIAASPYEEGVVIVTTEEGGVFVSWDRGDTWNRQTLCKGGAAKYVFYPSDRNRRYLVCWDELLTSADAGKTWSSVLDPSSRIWRLQDLEVTESGNRMYVAQYDGTLFRSDDKGGSWTAIQQQEQSGPLYFTDLAVSPTNPDILLANGWSGIWSSRDGGRSWSLIINESAGVAGGFVEFDRGGVAWAGRVLLYKSIDSGRSFEELNEWWGKCGSISPGRYYHADLGAIAFDYAANRIYIGTDGGVHVSVNGGATWLCRPRDMRNGLTYSLDIDPFDRKNIIVTRQDYGPARTTNGGITWDDLQFAEYGTVRFDPATPGLVYLAVSPGGLWKSTDHGKTFIEKSRGIPHGSPPYDVSLAIDPARSSTLWVGSGGLFKSVDAGESWQKVGNLVDINDIAVSPHSSGTVLVSGFTRLDWGSRSVWKSIDGGQSWSRIKFPEYFAGNLVGFQEPLIGKILIDPAYPGTIYFLSRVLDRLFVSYDGGSTITQLQPFDGIDITDMGTFMVQRIGTQSRITLAAAPEGRWGLYQSVDSGRTWSVLAKDMAVTDIEDIRPDPMDPNRLYVATWGAGILTIRSKTELVISSKTTPKVGGELRLSVSLSDMLGNPAPFEKVTVTVDGKNWRVTTDNLGKAGLLVGGAFPRAGSFTVTGTADGSLLFTSTKTSITVSAEPVTLIIRTGLSQIESIQFDGRPVKTDEHGMARFLLNDIEQHRVDLVGSIDRGGGSRDALKEWIDAPGQALTTRLIVAGGADIDLTARYERQYLLNITGGGRLVTNPSSSSPGFWFDEGTSVKVSTLFAWNNLIGRSRDNLVSYSIDGIESTVPREGSGEFTTPPIQMNKPYNVIFNSVKQYKLTITGDGFSVSPASPTKDSWFDTDTNAAIEVVNVRNLQGEFARRLRLASYTVDGISKSVNENKGVTKILLAMSDAHTVTLSSTAQYPLEISGGANVRVDPNSPTGDQWFDSTMRVVIRTEYGWNLVPNQSRQNLLSWSLDAGVTVKVGRRTSGVYATEQILMSSRHSVRFDSIIQFYLSVLGRKDVTINPVSQTADGWFDKNITLTVSIPHSLGIATNQSRYNLLAWSVDGVRNVVDRWGSGVFQLPLLTMDTHHVISFEDSVQFRLEVKAPRAVVVSVRSPTIDNWYDSGTVLNISHDNIWDEVGEKSRVRLASYRIDQEFHAQIANKTATTQVALTMNKPHTVEFIPRTQFYLKVTSEHAETGGEGWYDSGEEATFRVSTPVVGMLVREIFQGWEGDVTSVQANSSIFMDGNKQVVARWRTDYTNLIATVGVLVMALIALVYMMKMRNPRVI